MMMCCGWARVALLVSLTCLFACQTGEAVKAASPDDATTLQTSIKSFHKNLRWSRFDEASAQVSERYRQRFLGRYEEMGDDLHIVSLEVKKISFESKKDHRLAIVEIEQQWYREPNMTVKKDKIMEQWARRGDGWMLLERVDKKEWRERKERERKERKSKEEASAPSPS